MQADSQRRRLQRFVKAEQALNAFFAGWTGSVMRQMKPKVAVLVVDETKLKNQLGVMVVGVVYEGRCIPVAWRCIEPTAQRTTLPKGRRD